MLILAVSTSGAIASAALIRDGQCMRTLDADSDQRHAETVLPLIERLFDEVGEALSAVDLFAVDVGPGSFTGVRIGVSAVNAMAAAMNKKIVPVDSLRAIYASECDNENTCCILLDAGNGNAYAAQYRAGKELAPPEAVVTKPYLDAVAAGTVIVTDHDGMQQLVPEAEYVGLAADQMRSLAVDAALPMYLRPSQAERMWKRRQEAVAHGA